ncbi:MULTISPECIES: MogA/MoaB family molybdenum cofactor biosynthesis protein [Staphylococcus]|jgi:molybdenum cofactor biosynthesis protein B|uniref:MogA/MoaB family molybdenum cofactor biosynthesis protein n=1 Tax=Staphylococcus TaxID=1279 RepID=UPI0001EF4B24|nr:MULTISPECIES: molybdenum cofactor biosynthesis protein B [Staphylococcus]EAC7660520.1 molybdenum cofactor biosynthesis protein MoaB [Listeria monocytogenes]EFS16015.1 molybdenum cofactor biosynthesis protein B [Staphylococcus capitis C87]MBC3049541.1 molybdenum cofactor biosynthesis protein MoaB [Staphylococcus capitis]MBC3069521.1 molybdenum cofactor biosynthesis protein MoaB [Staphylococcus capitis]MBC3071295.1 molybdenum cofactor biosynthesis protein MoaB [Staphylococcus capitis]
MNNHQHEHVQLERNINVAILTVSDTRDFDSDKGGQLVQSLLKEINVSIEEHHYKIVKDDKNAITLQIKQWLEDNENIDVIITTGGTGISQRDVTIEAVRPLLTKELEGFGELFRYLSYSEDVGTRALLSRAIGGTAKDKLIFALPGSTGAVKLAIEKLIKPELNHLVHELTK